MNGVTVNDVSPVGTRQMPRIGAAGHGDAGRAPGQLQARRRDRYSHAQGRTTAIR